MGQINLSNSKGRDAIVSTQSVKSQSRVRWVDEGGRQAQMRRVLRATLSHDYETLRSKYEDPAVLGEALIAADPEIDTEMYGTFLRETSRVYVNPDRQVVHAVTLWDIVLNPDGTERERRPHTLPLPNTCGETPLKWSGKLLKKSEVYNKFVFSSKMQIVHVNGLTYDFLYGMAKDLEEKESFLLLGAGAKCNQPLVFRRGAVPYRGFVEGRTQGDRYVLLMHLSNMELKQPTQGPAEEVAE